MVNSIFIILIIFIVLILVAIKNMRIAQKIVIIEFLEQFCTNSSNDADSYEKYFTYATFQYFLQEPYLYKRTVESKSDNFNISIKDINISPVRFHKGIYKVSLVLIDNTTMKQVNSKFNMYLSKEFGSWKINYNTNLDYLIKDFNILFSKQKYD